MKPAVQRLSKATGRKYKDFRKERVTELLILITAITFYFIGKYSNTTKIEDTVKEIKHAIDKRNKPKPGVLPFKTPEEREAEKSGDKALEDEWISSGKADLIQK